MDSDLRDGFGEHVEEYRQNGWEAIPSSRAVEVQKAVGADAYFDCAPREFRNVMEVFQTAIRAALGIPTGPIEAFNQEDGEDQKMQRLVNFHGFNICELRVTVRSAFFCVE
jgi:hypothetical protein